MLAADQAFYRRLPPTAGSVLSLPTVPLAVT